MRLWSLPSPKVGRREEKTHPRIYQTTSRKQSECCGPFAFTEKGEGGDSKAKHAHKHNFWTVSAVGDWVPRTGGSFAVRVLKRQTRNDHSEPLLHEEEEDEEEFDRNNDKLPSKIEACEKSFSKIDSDFSSGTGHLFPSPCTYVCVYIYIFEIGRHFCAGTAGGAGK